MKRLIWLSLIASTAAFAGNLTSSSMQIETDLQGHERFVYTCVYSDGVVLQDMASCPFND